MVYTWKRGLADALIVLTTVALVYIFIGAVHFGFEGGRTIISNEYVIGIEAFLFDIYFVFILMSVFGIIPVLSIFHIVFYGMAKRRDALRNYERILIRVNLVLIMIGYILSIICQFAF